MQVIDIEARRSPRRETLQISFRRNDNDRRPARRYVRPNDEAPTWEQRLAESDRRLEAIKAKRTMYMVAEPKVEIPEPAQKQAEAERQRELYAKRISRMKVAMLLALNAGAETANDVSRQGVCSVRYAHKAATALCSAGLVVAARAEKSGPMGGVPQLTFRLTDAGREVIRTGAYPE